MGVERIEITPGELSECGRYKLGVTVDTTTPNRSTGHPSLLIAAFAWLERSRRSKEWPRHLVSMSPKRELGRAAFQPERLAKPCYLGWPGAKEMFGRELVRGGF